MKFECARVLAAVAMFTVAGVAAAEKCIYANVAPKLHSMGDEVVHCHTVTGYNMAPPLRMPTEEEQEGICTKCLDFIVKVTPMKWPDCTLSLGGQDQTLDAYFASIIRPCQVVIFDDVYEESAYIE